MKFWKNLIFNVFWDAINKIRRNLKNFGIYDLNCIRILKLYLKNYLFSQRLFFKQYTYDIFISSEEATYSELFYNFNQRNIEPNVLR